MQDISNLKMYSIKDVANILGVTYRTVQEYKKQGKITFVKIGSTYRISEEDLKEFLKGK